MVVLLYLVLLRHYLINFMILINLEYILYLINYLSVNIHINSILLETYTSELSNVTYLH